MFSFLLLMKIAKENIANIILFSEYSKICRVNFINFLLNYYGIIFQAVTFCALQNILFISH